MLRGFFAECPLTQLSRDLDEFEVLTTQPQPGLLAQIDQHAAAIRDSLTRDGLGMNRRSLTDYMRGFVDGARERGWHPIGAKHDWATLRLVSICWLARDLGYVR